MSVHDSNHAAVPTSTGNASSTGQSLHLESWRIHHLSARGGTAVAKAPQSRNRDNEPPCSGLTLSSNGRVFIAGLRWGDGDLCLSRQVLGTMIPHAASSSTFTLGISVVSTTFCRMPVATPSLSL